METPHVYGDFDHLLGIVNHPRDVNNDVGVILLTAGMLHHVGPFRLYVHIARALEWHGIVSMRFDLSGIGESLPVASSGTSLQRALHETRRTMDFLQNNYGINRFVLFGLCSGADDSFHIALHDDRVKGVVLLDGCGYRTRKFYARRLLTRYLPRLVNLRWWMSKIARRKHQSPSSLAMGTDVREFPNRDQAAKALQELVDRRVKLNFIYTGGVTEYFNHAGQFRAMFHDVEFRGQVSSRYFPQMDHVAILCEDRDLLVREVTDWIANQFSLPEEQENPRFVAVGSVAANVLLATSQ